MSVVTKKAAPIFKGIYPEILPDNQKKKKKNPVKLKQVALGTKIRKYF